MSTVLPRSSWNLIARKIHGISNCPLPSCAAGANPLCDAHLMENCHICAAAPTVADKVVQAREVEKPPKLLPPPPISDPRAASILAAAEAHAQPRQDVATIAANVDAL